ncbi:hypothetical protein SUGI_0018930 [Cryptomeria japonica]|nr:hypothetical protein SUGI_0018930 [Cryptomeria japonica]
MAAIHLLSLIFIQILLAPFFPSQNSKWVSPNGQFAFRFYPLPPTLYVVGIWFDRVSPKTIAWTILKDKQDVPVVSTSSLQLTDRALRLFDDRKNVLWSSNNTDKVATAAMLDNGNFVLLNASFGTIWQSFDYPTDTFLPGQTLKPYTNMFSRASTINFSAGRFELSMQWDNNLVLYVVERRGDPQGAYWATGTNGLQDGLSLKFDPSGLLYCVNSTIVTVYNLTEGEAGDGRFLHRVTLEIDGTFAQYVWNMDDNASSSWSSVWQQVSDPCKVKG